MAIPNQAQLEEIIIMEDDVNVQRAIKKWISALGFSAKTVGSAKEAVKLAKDNQKNYRRSFILDIHMGRGREQEGLDALEMIKNVNKDIFVSLLTSYPRQYANMALRLGADAVEYKTANINDDLIALLEMFLEHKRLLRQKDIKKVETKRDKGAIVESSVSSHQLIRADRAQLRKIMSETLDLNDLENLAFDMGIDFENLPTGNKDTKIRSLILYCERHMRLNDLIAFCRELHPGFSKLSVNSTIIKATPEAKVKSKSKMRFDVALSFPGEVRGIVEQVAKGLALKLGKDKVFYDKFYTAELARPNLDIYLQKIYHDKAELVVIFLCKDYEKKEWCGLEWRAIRDLIKKRKDENIMPFRLDNTDISGLFSIDGYVDARNLTVNEIVNLICSRVK